MENETNMEQPPASAPEELPPKEAEKLRKKEHELVGKPCRFYAKVSGDVPHAALITMATYDLGDETIYVNLAVFELSGVPVNKTGVVLVDKRNEKKAAEELDQYCVAAT